jgi:hypothetical protein
MYDMETIKTMYLKRAVESTKHFHDRAKVRNIKYSDIKNAIINGEIIEQILDDYPNPSILILGHCPSNKPLHIAIGVDDDKLWLITAYFPSLDMWEEDYRTRKVVDL